MAKLNQIVAVVSGKKTQAQKAITEVYTRSFKSPPCLKVSLGGTHRQTKTAKRNLTKRKTSSTNRGKRWRMPERRLTTCSM